MKYLRLILTICASIIISQAHAQGMNKANSGLEAVKGFMETSMTENAIHSKKMFSYLLPSYLKSNPSEVINFWSKAWKYDIEKRQGDFIYVAVFTEPDYKDMCNLVTFQTQQENGHWYLVPSGVEYINVGYVTPWAELIVETNYVLGSGPYLGSGIQEEIVPAFDNYGDRLLADLLKSGKLELVKSWDMRYPFNSLRGKMKIPRLLYGDKLAQYYITLEVDYKYLLVVIVDDKSLKPRATAGFIPQKNRFVPKEETSPNSFFPTVSVVFAPKKESKEVEIRGFVEGNYSNKSEHRLKAFLFKQPRTK